MTDDDKPPTSWTEPGPVVTCYPMVRRETEDDLEGVYDDMTMADLRRAAEAAGMRLVEAWPEGAVSVAVGPEFHNDVVRRRNERIAELEQHERTLREAQSRNVADLVKERDEARQERDGHYRAYEEARREVAALEKTVDEQRSRAKRAEVERDETRQVQPSVVPVKAVRELWEAAAAWDSAPGGDDADETRALLACVERHHDLGTFAALDQPGAVIVAESESDAQVLRACLARATIVERRHTDVLREAAKWLPETAHYPDGASIAEALDATAPDATEAKP